jgi:hypothetical protein
MQIGMADPAKLDIDLDVARPRLATLDRDGFEAPLGLGDGVSMNV